MQPMNPISRDLVPITERAHTEPEGLSLAALLGALRRRKGMILATVAVTLILVFAAVELLPKRYTATADLEIKPADTRAVVSKLVAQGLPEWMPGDNAEMVTQVGILRARAPMAQVVRTLRLVRDPEFQSTFTRLAQHASALIRPWLPASWQPAIWWLDAQESRAQREEVAVQRLQRALSIKQTEGAHIIQVAATAGDPVKAAVIANAVVKQYLDDQTADKYRTTERAFQWAEKQIRDQRAQLSAAEKATVTYMAAHGLTASNGFPQPNEAPPGRTTFGGLAGQQLFSLQDELVATRAQLAAQQARVAELDGMQAHHFSFASLPEVTSSPVIAELEKADAALRIEEARMDSTYGANSAVLRVIRARHAAITKHIKDEIAGIAQNIRDAAVTAHDRVARLEAIMSHSRKEYLNAENASVELRELTRDVAAKRELYDKLLLQVSEISQQLALIQPDANVVSAAVPPNAPSFPNKLLFGGIGVVGSLLLGSMLAALAEHSDSTLRTGAQVEQLLGVPNLGLVPRLETGRRREPLHTVIFRQPRSAYTEAIRTVLMQLLRPHAQVVLVTSALPKEGKTVTVLSLGAAAAHSGRRTVVVDFDLRRPRVASEAGLKVRAGLAEVLSNEVALYKALHVDKTDKRLHILPLRSPVFGSPDLLRKWDMQGLINTLRRRYDCIFLDMPPSFALSDIQPFADLADTALFVVQWGSTSCSAALNGMSALLRIGVPVNGVALTQVDVKRHALYGYEQFGEYHARYLEYFQQPASPP